MPSVETVAPFVAEPLDSDLRALATFGAERRSAWTVTNAGGMRAVGPEALPE